MATTNLTQAAGSGTSDTIGRMMLQKMGDLVQAVTNQTAAGGAYATYTPVITAGTGTITTASAAGRFKQIGKTVFVQMEITVTTNGSGAGFVIATLPVSASSTIYIIPGRERAAVGKMLQGICVGTQCEILNYDNTYPAANGYVLDISGTYESA